MTKCFLTGKTYPDYEPTDAEQREDFQRELYKAIGSWGDFVNHEQTNLAVECAKLIINLNNNNADAFKQTLHEINTATFKGMQDKYLTESERIEKASELADLFMQGLHYGEVTDDGEGVYVEEENGDIRYSDWAQDIFNERYDYHMAESYFEPDDVCRNGKPIADCECC